jgi:hypothetical protein
MSRQAAAGHLRGRKLWSVPRLRGRGKQGNIAMHTYFCQRYMLGPGPLHAQELGAAVSLPYP